MFKLPLRGPSVAEDGQAEPTTGNIHIYCGELPAGEFQSKLFDPPKTNFAHRKIFLVDVEGENGKVPRLLKRSFHEFLVRFLPQFNIIREI
jgi:hypothetical protein